MKACRFVAIFGRSFYSPAMKYLLLAAPLSLLVFNAQAQKPSLRALEEKNGFRDLHFGDDTASVAGLVREHGAGAERWYTRPVDSKTIGGATAQNISYMFYKGKLATVAVEAHGSINGTALKDALEAQYSWGLPENQYSKRYFWKTKSVAMSLDNTTDKVKLFIFGRPQLAERERDEKATAQKAKSDL